MFSYRNIHFIKKCLNRKDIGSGHIGDIFLDISVLAVLVLNSCVQAKNSFLWRKSLLQDKKIKKTVPAVAPRGAAPKQVKKT
jgi:hypothetical protein